ncbi:MAG: thioredoxin domain-containing protein [Bacteroidales bacterium]
MKMTNSSDKSSFNKLINEQSPYLRQHAENPVNWYPWGDEAFEKAKKEDKPIFLSIGYSTCHWCHVMAHESFKDQEVAELMNEAFVSIKVDREERPDIDKIYMTVCQLMTGSGGWPLTIIMTPDKKPFFAGTYFPKESRHGRTGLKEMIPRIKDLWENEREKLLESGKEVVHALQDITDEAPGNKVDNKILMRAYNQLAMRYEEKYGGFNEAPKFPSPHNLYFLLRFWKRTQNQEPLNMVEKTLKEMRKGGIFDHIGYGFHRYSTDKEWLVPHFEKMLYDQALIAMAYLEAYQATKDEIYERTAREIFTYVLRDMRSPDGGFFSAEDADSEGVEGKFYVWKTEELKEILSEKDYKLVKTIFNIEESGNYLEEATRQKTGKNILHMKKSLQEYANDLNYDFNQLKMELEQIRTGLFEYREKRIHPHKDDKILTDWNGLMIAALAKGGRILEEPEYTNAAEKAIKFISKNLEPSKGKLLHRFKDGHSEIDAFIDDYSFLIWGLIELYETTFNTDYLEKALNLNKYLSSHFWDQNIGGFFFTSDEAEELIVRQKEIYDGAIPSGNSVALLNLLRLYFITGNQDLDKKADILSRVFSEKIKNNPSAFTQFLTAVDFEIGPSYSLVISGDKDTESSQKMINLIRRQFLPNKTTVFRNTAKDSPEIDKYSDFISYFEKLNEKATAYVCVNKTCKPPTNDPQEMLQLLEIKR